MKQDSDMEADSTLPECEEKEVGISDVPKDEGNVEELPTKNEGKMKEATSSAVQHYDTEMKECIPTEEVDETKEGVTEVENTSKDGKSDDKCIEELLPKEKKVLKTKRKIVKKSPATRVLRSKKAQVEQDDDKKEKDAPVAQEVGETLEAQCSKNEKEAHVAQEVEETIAAHGSTEEKEVDVAPEGEETLATQCSTEEKEVDVVQEVEETQATQCSTGEKEVDVAQEVVETPEAQCSKKEEEVDDVALEVGETEEAQCSKKEKEVDVAQEIGETLEARNPIENSSKPEAKMKKINKVLKVKKKIVKKSPASNQTKTNKLQSSSKVQARKRLVKNKSPLQENGEGSEKMVEDSEKPSKDEKFNESIAKEECIAKGEETSTGHKNSSEFKINIKEQKTIEKVGSSDKSIKNRKRKLQDREQKSRREDENEENLGGLIFMCSAKTKPDCFHYNVMGVSVGKKDAVEAIKPGLKLFLYDFDLRLLYGIYKASSSGGMKLEPKAFNGAFPAQVRFTVYKDCLPLPENIFKKAIQENYYEKHKFKVELTVKQVRKLSGLFRPIGGPHSSSAIVRSRPEVPIRDRKGKGKDTRIRNSSGPIRDRRGKGKDSRIRNSRSKDAAKNDRLSSHIRDRHRGEASRRREEVPHGFYRSEKDYRTYGLREERRNDYERRHLEPRFRDDVSVHAQREVVHADQRELVRADQVYFDGKDYPVYSVDSRSQISPPRAISGSGAYHSIYSRPYAVPLIDPYLLPSRREEAAPTFLRSYVADTDPIRHLHHKDEKSDRMPVSSRYAFAGPSYLYR